MSQSVSRASYFETGARGQFHIGSIAAAICFEALNGANPIVADTACFTARGAGCSAVKGRGTGLSKTAGALVWTRTCSGPFRQPQMPLSFNDLKDTEINNQTKAAEFGQRRLPGHEAPCPPGISACCGSIAGAERRLTAIGPCVDKCLVRNKKFHLFPKCDIIPPPPPCGP